MKKKVALLGDSIRLIGYGQKVEQMLGADYEIFQPEENCRFAKYTLRMLFDYAENLKDCEIIHWNNGLWDCADIFDDGAFTSEEEYVENMIRIAKKLKEITPKVIFATTTPTRLTYTYTRNERIDRYNELIVPKLQEIGIYINDLNILLKGRENEMICDDEIHLSEKGVEVCADAVCKAIKRFV